MQISKYQKKLSNVSSFAMLLLINHFLHILTANYYFIKRNSILKPYKLFSKSNFRATINCEPFVWLNALTSHFVLTCHYHQFHWCERVIRARVAIKNIHTHRHMYTSRYGCWRWHATCVTVVLSQCAVIVATIS